jgi:hypothetical protein
MGAIMLPAYRIVYFIVAAFFLANVLGTQYIGMVPAATVVLKLASAAALCGSLVLVVAFSRICSPVFWISVSVSQILFVWYAWLSPGAPLTELLRDRMVAGVLFALLSAWFRSLPVVRTVCQRSRAAG